MSKVCSKIFWMRECCRNTNRMPFVSGFSLEMKRSACSTQSRSFFLPVEQLDSHGFSSSFFASKEKKGDWEFSGFLQAVLHLKLRTKEIQRNIQGQVFGKAFSIDRHISFFSSQRIFWISAGWEIHHEASVYILISHEVASQEHISAPAVPDGPSYAHKDGHFSSSLSEETQERFALERITNSPGRTCIWSSFAQQRAVQASLKRCSFAPCLSVQHFTFPQAGMKWWI